jgi:hypothetical protein
VIIAPAAASDQGEPPPPVRLHATATLLAAPAPLASELGSLYAATEQVGREQGLEPQDVWSHHWQPLMDDICLLSTLARGAGSAAGAPMQPSTAVSLEMAQTLVQFFSLNAMPGWQAEAQCVLDMISRQREERQHHVMGPPGESALPQMRAEPVQAEGGATATSHPAPTSMLASLPSIAGAGNSKAAQVGHNQGSPASGHTPQWEVPVTTNPPSGTAVSSTGNEANTTQCPDKSSSVAPAPRQPPPAATSTFSIRAWVLWFGSCLHLLWAGFPDPGDEREWQSDISVTSVAATDPVGLVCQAGIVIASMTRTPHDDGLMFRWPLLYLGHSAGWVIALLWWVP